MSFKGETCPFDPFCTVSSSVLSQNQKRSSQVTRPSHRDTGRDTGTSDTSDLATRRTVWMVNVSGSRSSLNMNGL